MNDEDRSGHERDQVVISMLNSAGDVPPTAWRTTSASTLAYGRRVLRRRRLVGITGSLGLAGVVVLGVSTLADPGRANDVIMSPADAAPSTTASAPACPIPDGSFTDDDTTPGLEAAKKDVIKLGNAKSSRKYYTGLSVCAPQDSLFVYRVPGGKAFDATVASIAERRDVDFVLIDTKYSSRTLDGVESTVKSRRGALAEAGAPLKFLVKSNEGYVAVVVASNSDAAAAVLADLGDRVEIVEGNSPTAAIDPR